MHKNNGSYNEAATSAARIGLTPSVLPEVLNINALGRTHTQGCQPILPPPQQVVNENIQEASNAHSNWYALKATYGREKVAYDYLVSKGVTAFCPMQKTVKIVQGKRKIVEQSRLPNIFFAFGTEAEIKSYVYDNVHLPFLRFYYRHLHKGAHIEREPLIVPQRQIDTFKIICSVDDEDTFISPTEIHLFERGDLVRITQGKFAGVTGRVANFKGQRRVGIYIDGMATIATSYVPKAYLKKI